MVSPMKPKVPPNQHDRTILGRMLEGRSRYLTWTTHIGKEVCPYYYQIAIALRVHRWKFCRHYNGRKVAPETKRAAKNREPGQESPAKRARPREPGQLGPKKRQNKRKPFCQKNDGFGEVVHVPACFRLVIFRKINWFYLEVQGSFGG